MPTGIGVGCVMGDDVQLRKVFRYLRKEGIFSSEEKMLRRVFEL